MKMTIYTLWAALPDELDGFWMLHAEDAFSYEGDPDRCDAAFKTAQAQADRSGWVTREVEIEIDCDDVERAFRPAKVEGSIE